MRKIVLKSAIAMLVVSVLPIPGFISNAAARLFEIGLSPPAGGALNLGSTTYTRDHATFWTAANESSQPASPATGNEIGPGITYDDATNILSFDIAYGSAFGFTDLVGDFALIHFHAPGPVNFPALNTNAAVIHDLAGFHTPSTAKSGRVTGTVVLTAAQEVDLFDNEIYLNLHTDFSPGGEIRAQLVPVGPILFLNNNDRLGDVGIFQYYTVQGGWQTFIRVINTSAEAVSVKVRFREAANSREVLDFIIFLSPYDMWSGWTDADPTDGVTDSGSTAVIPGLRTNDSSCLFPLPNGNNTTEGFKSLAGGGLGADFQSRAYSGAYADGGAAFHTDLARMSEGHLEMIGIASHPALSTFGLAVTHNQATGMPTNCSQAADLFSAQVIGSTTRTTADTDLPNVLAFNGYVINVSKGQAGGFDPDVLADFHTGDGTATLVDAALATATDPDMDSATGIFTPEARVKQKGKSGPTAVLGGVDAVSWLFQRTGVINEWAASANPLAIVKDYYTQWVLTFFTKHYYVDLQNDPDPGDDVSPTLADPDDAVAANDAYRPFNEEFDQGVTAGHACEPYRIRIFNREEAARSFTSPAPSTPVEICDETNVIVFHENYASEGLKSNFTVTIPTQLLPVDADGTTSDRGWALLDFWAPGNGILINSVLKGSWAVMNNVGGGIPGIPDAILNQRFLEATGVRRWGLPVTGWMLSVYNTGAADTNHTNINAHKYTRSAEEEGRG